MALNLHERSFVKDLPRSSDVARRPLLRTLFVDDGSALSQALLSKLDPTTLALSRVAAGDTTDSVLEAMCSEVEAVVVASAGWDVAAAERVSASLDQLIRVLDGSGKRLLYLSDATVIGDTGDSFGNEDSPRSSKPPHGWHVAAEQNLARAATTGIRSIIIRPALVHGDHAGILLERLRDHARHTGKAVFVGDGTARTSTVHIDDLASLLRLAVLRAPSRSIYMAASPEVLSWRDIASVVAVSTSPPATTASVTAERADELGLDVATMAVNCVIRDDSPHRRLGWVAQGPTLGPATPHPT
jgi:nucleoside-diphosphate-sugar epimerase